MKVVGYSGNIVVLAETVCDVELRNRRDPYGVEVHKSLKYPFDPFHIPGLLGFVKKGRLIYVPLTEVVSVSFYEPEV